jgi:tRNA(adenine34) deaminase
MSAAPEERKRGIFAVIGTQPTEDRRFMAIAIEEARRAAVQGEVPVGAVLITGGELLALRGNERERRNDPTAHAEMLVLRDGAAIVGGWRLQEATLYVTLEPCAMCAGAMVLARIKRLVYGADDPKAGAAGSVFNVVDHPALNHRPQVLAGIMAEEASELLREFFESRR